jgi:hypothetical protein
MVWATCVGVGGCSVPGVVGCWVTAGGSILNVLCSVGATAPSARPRATLVGSCIEKPCPSWQRDINPTAPPRGRGKGRTGVSAAGRNSAKNRPFPTVEAASPAPTPRPARTPIQQTLWCPVDFRGDNSNSGHINTHIRVFINKGIVYNTLYVHEIARATYCNIVQPL